jgi:tetratricopeptide (TPR) repeat protein
MNFKINLILWFALIFMMACSGSKMVVSEKANAETATEMGNYKQATAAWKNYFAQTPVESISGGDFAQAAQTAFKSGASDLAVDWFDQARYKNYADVEMYRTLAKIYRSENNISKELSSLEYISENYNDSAIGVDQRLFELYNEVKLYDKALRAWNRLDEVTKSKTENLDTYFHLKKVSKDEATVDSVAFVLLQKNPAHVEALEWLATKFYWQGENRYQREMKIYENNTTRKQHRILVKELDIATVDLKKSLGYFEKLWEIEPDEKYAGYMANIHTRFGEEDKAKYYQKYVK